MTCGIYYNGTLFSLEKEIPNHASTWIGTEDIMLTEINRLNTNECIVNVIDMKSLEKSSS